MLTSVVIVCSTRQQNMGSANRHDFNRLLYILFKVSFSDFLAKQELVRMRRIVSELYFSIILYMYNFMSVSCNLIDEA